MRQSIICLLFVSAFVACVLGGNDYLWGNIESNDYLISRTKVSKMFILGVSVSTKYVYKQKDNLNAYTITAIKVIDQKKKDGATATLLNGGPGSKGATIAFKSKKGSGIKDIVEIYGR